MTAITLSTGDKKGRLTLTEVAGQNKWRLTIWNAVCDCGKATTVTSAAFHSGQKKSCGCFRVDKIRETKRTHGQSRTADYGIWCDMISRCYLASNPSYSRYGGRGIGICERWRESFPAFLLDMGPRPTPDHSVERIDNNGWYEPINCVWATRIEQGRNKRNNVWVTLFGEKMIVAEAARRIGIVAGPVYGRARKLGVPIQESLDHFVKKHAPLGNLLDAPVRGTA